MNICFSPASPVQGRRVVRSIADGDGKRTIKGRRAAVR
jgi:hypothetical protein